MAQWAHEMAGHRDQDNTCTRPENEPTSNNYPGSLLGQRSMCCSRGSLAEADLLPTPERIRGNLVKLVGKLTVLTHFLFASRITWEVS